VDATIFLHLPYDLNVPVIPLLNAANNADELKRHPGAKDANDQDQNAE